MDLNTPLVNVTQLRLCEVAVEVGITVLDICRNTVTSLEIRHFLCHKNTVFYLLDSINTFLSLKVFLLELFKILVLILQVFDYEITFVFVMLIHKGYFVVEKLVFNAGIKTFLYSKKGRLNSLKKIYFATLFTIIFSKKF